METEKAQQIDLIYQLIMELASGNLGYRAPIVDENNELGAIAIGINMLAEELQATTVSKNYLNRIYKGVVDILIVLKPDFTIQQVNDTACKALGYKEHELIGQGHHVLFMHNQTRSLNRIRRELEKKSYTHDIQRQMRTKRGKSVPVSLSCSLLYNDENEVNGILYIAKDISKLKRTEDQLRTKNEELNTFIYRASHDLKGPLTSAVGLIGLAKQEVKDRDSAEEYFDLIGKSLNRLNDILDDFLELGRLTQGAMGYSTINFKSIVKDIIDSLSYLPEFRDFDVQVNIKLKSELRSKKNLVKAILHNLIENSFKYRRLNIPNPMMQVDITTDEDEVLIEVSDNGIGMSKSVQENIFKMFYRGNYQSEGSGLGLYIVKVSVDALRGRIKVVSKPDEGTTFSVWIPNRA